MNRIPNSTKRSDEITYPAVSIIIVIFNDKDYIKKCLDSVMKQDYPEFEVLVVDNGSEDGGVEYVEQNYPGAKVIRNARNLGYSGGNNVGFALAKHDYIAVLNPDTRVDPLWLKELVSVINGNDSIGMVTPKAIMGDSLDILNTCGNEISVFGLTFCRGLEEHESNYTSLEQVSAISGVCFLIRKQLLETIGGFHEDFFLYFEDTDLSLRCMLAGYDIYFVPTSIIYHDYLFKYSGLKAFHQEKNRHFTFLSVFKWPTLILLLPGLIFSELISWSYAVIGGLEILKGKAKSYQWLLQNLANIKATRARNFNYRTIPDSKIIRMLGCRIRFGGSVSHNLAVVMESILAPFTCLWAIIVKTLILW